MATLVIEEGGRTWRPAGAVCTVGRDPACDIVLPGERVAGRHAIFELHDTGPRAHVVVRDAGSTSGTFVNASPIERPTVLRDGDTVTIGDSTLRARAEEDQPETDRVPAVATERELPADPPRAGDEDLEPLTPRVMDPVAPLEDRFLDALRASPGDDETRSVYADWLEERGQRLKAEFLRIQCRLGRLPDGSPHVLELDERLRAISPASDAWWRAVTSRPSIEQCGARLARSCPKRWAALLPTADPAVRHCRTCDRSVRYCATLTEVLANGGSRGCVVFDASLARDEALAAYTRAADESSAVGRSGRR
jgi:uncharacterized protein (TIGR02996 family)